MEPSWISIAISAIVLIVQLTSRYHKDGAASEVNLRNLEALFMHKLAEIQIQIAKLPDEMMSRVNQGYVTNDKYHAEMDSVKDRIRNLERTTES